VTGKPRGYHYGHHQAIVVSAKIDHAFDFLADPAAIPLLDPPWTGARLIPAPGAASAPGDEREYVLRWLEIPVYLRIRVAEFEHPHRLVLEQALGPWQSFRQVFALRAVEEGTEIAETIDVRAMPGVVDHVVHRLVVARQLRAIDAFRRTALLRHLGAPAPRPQATRG
jgi:hypothetical protein